MALNKVALKASIRSLLKDMSEREEPSIDEYADRLSGAIDEFVKSGKVNAGIAVSTTGTAAAQTGQTTSLGTIS